MTEQDDITYIKEKVDKIYKCLFEGNGVPSFTTRLTLVEKAVAKHQDNWTLFVRTLIRDVMVAGVMGVSIAVVLSKLI